MTDSDARRTAPSTAPGAGDVLASRYRLLARIGHGGFGEVFEAEDEALGIHVALEVLRLDGRDPVEGVRRLQRAELLARGGRVTGEPPAASLPAPRTAC